MQTHNDSAYAKYDLFRVGSSRERYRLSVGNYRGTAGKLSSVATVFARGSWAEGTAGTDFCLNCRRLTRMRYVEPALDLLGKGFLLAQEAFL